MDYSPSWSWRSSTPIGRLVIAAARYGRRCPTRGRDHGAARCEGAGPLRHFTDPATAGERQAGGQPRSRPMSRARQGALRTTTRSQDDPFQPAMTCCHVAVEPVVDGTRGQRVQVNAMCRAGLNTGGGGRRSRPGRRTP